MPEADKDEPLSLRQSIAIWQVRNHVTQTHCDELLKLLRPHHPELPTCTRALVRTPRRVEITEMNPGLYFHRGLEPGIRQTLIANKVQQVGQNLSIHLSTDGVSLTNSSKSQFWPVVGYIPSLPDSSPFEVGVYWGWSKPVDPNELLKRGIEEAEDLYQNGMIWREKKIRVKIDAFVCDAPARAMITRTKSHSSVKNGCSRCTGTGVQMGDLRTNHSFRLKLDVPHHHGRSIIENLEYFDCVNDVPLDAMHLIDLGVMKRILEFLFRPEKTHAIANVTLNPATIRAFNSSLLCLKPYISRFDFARIPPSDIKDLPRLKATQFKQLLHYTAVVLFKQHLSSSIYRHFLLFHVGVRLLSFKPWCVDFNAYAHELLCCFVRNSPSIFSESFVCYNVHSLFHVAQDVSNHGPLYSYSAYRFENFYRFMKMFLKKSGKPLHQLAKRLKERNQLSHLMEQYESRTTLSRDVTFSYRHRSGPVVQNCRGIQYRKAALHGSWTLQTKEPDNCVFLKDLSVVEICNFVKQGETKIVIGRKFRSKRDYYKSPLPSSRIYEYEVSNRSLHLEAWDMKHILFKAVKLPSKFPNTGHSYVVFPLMMQ